MKTEMPLNTVIEASKQIRNASLQLKPYNPSDKPLTNFSFTAGNLGQNNRLFVSPQTSIRVSNLMKNGVSYPTAKKIQKKSLNKQQQNASIFNTRGSLQNDSIMSQASQGENSNHVHFMDELIGSVDPVQLPKISDSISGLATRHASVSNQANENAVRRSSMKLYTTFIRKVNEFNVKRRADKLDSYKMKQPEPTHFQKYKKYMNMLDEDDGSFPRVSELSMRLEQDRMMDESRKRLEIAKERQRQKNLED